MAGVLEVFKDNSLGWVRNDENLGGHFESNGPVSTLKGHGSGHC